MLHSAKPFPNGVTHCQLCQACNRASTHPLITAVTFLFGTYLLMHIHSVLLNFLTFRKVSRDVHGGSFGSSPEDFDYLAERKKEKKMQCLTFSICARFKSYDYESDHSPSSRI